MSEMRPTQDERLMAALAHASIILGPFTSGVGGIVAALVIWLTQREKSKYVAFQALQAVAYQGVGGVRGIIGWGCYVCGIFGSLIPVFVHPRAYQHAPPPPTFWAAMCLLPLIFLAMGIFALYGLWAAWCAWQGRDFRYVVLGRMLEGRLK